MLIRECFFTRDVIFMTQTTAVACMAYM